MRVRIHPMAKRGKRAARWTLVAAVSVLGASAFAFRSTLLEYWYIAGLYSSEDGRRLECADKLADRKSLRAVPHLVDRIRADEREMCVWVRVHSEGDRVRSEVDREEVELRPLVHALYRIGPETLPKVAQLLAGEDQRLNDVLKALKRAWQLPATSVLRGEYGEVGTDPMISTH